MKTYWIAAGCIVAATVVGLTLCTDEGDRSTSDAPERTASASPQPAPAATLVIPPPAPKPRLERAPSGAESKSAPRKLTVELGDGTSIVVAAKPMQVAAIRRPERLADVLEELRGLADAGDVGAAYSLGRWLKECGRIQTDEGDLEKAVARVRSEGFREYPSTSDLPGSGHRVSDVAATEASMRRHFGFCEGVSTEERSESAGWLELAASSGYLLAKREQASDFRLDRDRYFEMHEAMWREYGDMGALSALAMFYRAGRVPGGGPDYVHAYAYQFANLKLYEAIFANSVYPSHRNGLRAIEDALSNTGSYLTPQQTAEAEAIGRRLLTENPNCCVSFFFGQTH